MSRKNEDIETQNVDEQETEGLEGNEETLEVGKEVEETETSTKDKSDDSAANTDAWKKALETEVREKIRKEEKEKLYKSFEKYKEDAKNADEARKAAEEKLQDYETSKLSAEEQAALKLQQLEESNVQLQSAMEKLVEEANDKINTLQIELVKKEILSQYGDEILPTMVSGSTIEELQESAENAHKEYMAIYEKAEAKLKETGKGVKPPVGTPINPQNNRLKTGVTVSDLEKITDPKIWEANRDKYLEDALKQQ